MRNIENLLKRAGYIMKQVESDGKSRIIIIRDQENQNPELKPINRKETKQHERN